MCWSRRRRGGIGPVDTRLHLNKKNKDEDKPPPTRHGAVVTATARHHVVSHPDFVVDI